MGQIMQLPSFLNGTEQARVIGASDTTVPSDNATVSFMGAGASGGAVQSNLFSNVKISELIVLNDSSQISRKAIETYLARKWGAELSTCDQRWPLRTRVQWNLKDFGFLRSGSCGKLPHRSPCN